MNLKRWVCVFFLFANFLRASNQSLTVKSNPDGSFTLENSLIKLRVSSRPGQAQGILGWFFKPTGFEMVDVLYGQTDYVRGHVFGEQWEPVNWKEFQGKAPDVGKLLVPRVHGTAENCSGAVLIQESQGSYRLTKTWILRRDLATVEVNYRLENLSAEPSGFSLRFHGAASPGARGKYQRKDDTIFLETEAGLLALDQSLNRTRYQMQYGDDKFFGPAWKDEPARHWVSGRLKTPILKGNWAAQVNRSSGDALVVLMEEKTLVGFYNCPGITLEPVLKSVVLKPGDTWETKAYLSSCTGVTEPVRQVTPLYLVLSPLVLKNSLLQGKIVPLFSGRLRVEEKTGVRAAEFEACPEKALVVSAPVSQDWKLVAVDTEGAVIGEVDSSGRFLLSQVVVKAKPSVKPAVKTGVYHPEQTRERIKQFLTDGNFTVYCSASSTEEEKAKAIVISRRTGAGLAWTNPGGKMLAVGNPATNVVVKEAGLWKNSVSETWPGPGKGALLIYDSYEDTQQPLLLISGSDPVGTVKAAEKFVGEYLRTTKEIPGFAFWVAGPEAKVYPYSRPPRETTDKVSLKLARGEYEVEQL
ncbi:MAG TPA: hypothetical protein PKW42_08005, partial [bacterium]|nr:hypothetical protein [bacterium]